MKYRTRSESNSFQFCHQIYRSAGEIEHEIELECGAHISGRYYPATLEGPEEYPELEVAPLVVKSITDERGASLQEVDGYRVGEETDNLTEAEMDAIRAAGWAAAED